MAITGVADKADRFSLKDAFLALRIGSGGSFVDCRTWLAEATFTPHERDTEKIFLLDGTGIISPGNNGPGTVQIKGFATWEATDPFLNLLDEHDTPANNSEVDIQMGEAGATTGSDVIETSGGILKSVKVPDAKGDAPGIAMFEATIEVDRTFHTTIS